VQSRPLNYYASIPNGGEIARSTEVESSVACHCKRWRELHKLSLEDHLEEARSKATRSLKWSFQRTMANLIYADMTILSIDFLIINPPPLLLGETDRTLYVTHLSPLQVQLETEIRKTNSRITSGQRNSRERKTWRKVEFLANMSHKNSQHQ